MAYNTLKLYNKAVRIITKNPMLIYIEELAAELGISKNTFYDHFPENSYESDALKDLLQENKTKIKRGLRTRWMKQGVPTTDIALYKLCGTAEEREILNNQRLEITGKAGEALRVIIQDV